MVPDLSPDGKQVVYQWDGRTSETDGPGNWDIYVQLVEGGDPHQLTRDPAPETSPVWSPDGLQIAFIRGTGDGRGKVYIVPALGGTERLASSDGIAATLSGLDWSPDGRWLAVTLPGDWPRGIGLLSLATGEIQRLTSPLDAVDLVPRFSPDGRSVALIRNRTGAGLYGDLYVVGVAGGTERRLTFDERGMRGHDWTPDGKELVFSSDRRGHWTLWRVGTDTSTPVARPLAGVGTDAYRPTISKNGGRLAYEESRLDADILRIPITLGTNGSPSGLSAPMPIAGSTRPEASPQLSPDGRRLVFMSRRGGDQAIWVSDPNGLNALQVAAFPGYPAGSPRWSPDGQRIVFDASIAGPANIFVVSAHGGEPVPLTADAGENVVPSWSRDGRWIYFASDRSGRKEVWKVAASGGPAVQVTRGGGFVPFESNDGKFVYYMRDINIQGIWRVPVGGGEEEPVVDGPPRRDWWGYWALLPDGIYFASLDGEARALVKYFEFATKQIKTLGHLDAPFLGGPFFEVSPDGRWLFYTKNMGTTSDIVLVNNFR